MKDILKQVKRIEITTKHLVDGLIAGNYHSVFKGQGIEFSDIREYMPGDDIRSIDWKVTARFDQPYVKEFIEERDLNVYFAFDFSGSSSFGSTISKVQKALELTASLMFSAVKNNDNIGLFLFTDRLERFIPARKGRKHLLQALSTLVSYEPKSRATDINNALASIAKIIKKRSVLFVISDFHPLNFMQAMKLLKARHDVIAINVSDTRESGLPDVGLIQLEDEETGEQILVNTSDRQFRTNYQRMMAEENLKLASLFRKLKVDTINILTDEPYETPLRKFFKTRKYRVAK